MSLCVLCASAANLHSRVSTGFPVLTLLWLSLNCCHALAIGLFAIEHQYLIKVVPACRLRNSSFDA